MNCYSVAATGACTAIVLYALLVRTRRALAQLQVIDQRLSSAGSLGEAKIKSLNLPLNWHEHDGAYVVAMGGDVFVGQCCEDVWRMSKI